MPSFKYSDAEFKLLQHLREAVKIERMASQSTSPAWLERPVLRNPSKILTVENLLIALILVLAIISRFAMLGERVMSHDEVNHVVPAYDLFQGKGYRHDPVTHGPFQFHALALSYFLFGDNDFTSRIPAALFSVAAVAFVLFAYRRYLGRSGAIIAGLLFLISPFMLFYGRYTRNEAFIELIGVALLYGILRYLERGDRFAMFLVTISTVLHFTVKETAFIYTAQALIFLFVMFLLEARRAEFRRPERYNRFLLLMSIAMLLVFLALGLAIWKVDAGIGVEPAGVEAPAAGQLPTETPTEAPPGSLFDQAHLRLYGEIIAVTGALLAGAFGLLTLARDLGWGQIKRIRSFTLIILIGTLILPMLAPLPITMLGGNPLDYTNTANMIQTGIVITALFIVGALIGLWWNPALWLQNALIFYTIFTVFYTTIFTNGDGFYTGIVGSLGYWLAQQSVERGSQPRYYYAFVQMPIYEFLAILGTLTALYYAIRHRRFAHLAGFAPAFAPRVERQDWQPAAEQDDAVVEIPATGGLPEPADGLPNETGAARVYPDTGDPVHQTALVVDPSSSAAQVYAGPEEAAVSAQALEDAQAARFYSQPQPSPVLALLLFWSLTSLLAYSLAGERMPWLTVHIALPFLLTAGWGLGYLVDTTDWKRLLRLDGFLAVLLFPVAFTALSSAAGSLLGTNPPFQGSQLTQLQATNRFILAAVAAAGSLAGIVYLLRDWTAKNILRLAAVTFFALMAVLTARAAYRASFINYDYATEYLVYAHAAPGPKEVLAEVEEISRRTVGGKDIQVAYSSDALYPYWWYFRDYPNHRWYQSNPTRDLRDFPVVIAGEDVFNKIEPVLGDEFILFDYIRLWWPNQDYYNLTFERVWGALTNPQMREGIYQIWLNRDYSTYAEATGQPSVLSLENWSPAARMRVYIRKDVVAQIWSFGATPAVIDPVISDPYSAQTIDLNPIQVVGSVGVVGAEPGQFNAPRGLETAPDGTLYVADSRNHRIQYFSADGSLLGTWGTFGDVNTGTAPDGAFNEPWDVAIGPDGSVYVSDTWNHRVQKFTADGQFVTKWGYFGQGEAPEALWGPRGLAVDQDGRVYVMDTGNKRVVIFDADGNYITQFGSAGFEMGQFDEPVGIDLDPQGNVYITDTWNQRVQVMAPSQDRLTYTPLRAWDFSGWRGQSLENKPFLAVDPASGHVFVADPESPRIVAFDAEGSFLRAWGEYSSGPDGFGMVSGVTVAPDGSLWVSDGVNNILLRFELPE